MHTAKTVTILLADDHTMMREGTRRLLEEDPALEVIGEAQNGEEVLAFCNQKRPDVVVLDISMRGLNGFGVAQALCNHYPHPPAILVLTAYDQIAYVQTMLKIGVKGYWLKSARGSDIRQAIHEVAAGHKSLAPDVRRLLSEEEENPLPTMQPLTSRELEVLRLVVQGLRNSEISQRLSVTVKTVETHLTSLYGKLGVQSRAEAIALAQRQELLLE
ncbi:response regulator [Tengunoibacter tsumagoiensis]|uniref:DNA-binding response regulator n=1 Tax=Tengunoibacter tsumagoiensis TaxID=2014871 RepID=A0A401ZVP7_9CHLR|nr:response regulator transcription factor [Tengunoibacter tsumagoiensis]GCE10979.1 DNA-binding response regulator [Tengunoibacter tsumagoiensis]